MPSISQQLQQIRHQIHQLADLSLTTTPPCLIAVTKNFPGSAIRAAYAAGQRQFGENYIQELQAKATELSDLNLEWHFIGQIQSNKTKALAETASWVHSLTKLSHAIRLNQQRPDHLAPLKVLLEVKINHDPNKHGLESISAINDLANEIAKLPKLELCGLMGIASDSQDQQLIKSQFMQLADYRQQLNLAGHKLSHLSMGMSKDYPLAITCGATLLRIGSKIFGARN